MAEKRMFSKKVTNSDAFLEMPPSAQALYFHLNMDADDDGFVNAPKRIMKIINASEDDMKLLIIKRFIMTFDSGIIVIKHWRMHNILRKDRYKPTDYQEEFQALGLKENGVYTEAKNLLATKWQPDGNQMSPRIDKNSIDKNRIDNIYISDTKGKKFIPPTIDEVRAYCKERNNNVDAERFVNFYESKGWMVGKNKMKDWKASVRTWEQKNKPVKRNTDDILEGIL